MEFQRVSRKSVPDEVFEQLMAQMVSGKLAPGDSLPSERRLAELLGVSRPAVREALQRLAQSGLVDVRQGGATTVQDYRQIGGLDLLPRLLVQPDGEFNWRVGRSIVETRLQLGPNIAELAARRRTPELEPQLAAVVGRIGDAADEVERARAAVDYWDLLVDAADSIVYRLLYNGLRAAYEPVLESLGSLMSAEVDQVDLYQGLADVIVAGYEEAARRAATELLTPATEMFLTVFQQLEEAE
ncbi:FadR family transcriptional regulator [Pseudonocardiaceae bacterium YIM PH 21723]|nr:FadR family transcriptional regulator [Pseudonocardiaceae bacterium YIM PH 21723]